MKIQFNSLPLLRSFLGVSGLFLVGTPLLLLANIVLARSISVAEFGAFGFVIALATVLAIPMSGGLPLLLTREVATYSQQENWSAYRGLIGMAYCWVVGISAIMGIGLVGWILISGQRPDSALLITFLLLPFIGLNGIRNGILKGLGKPALAEAPTLLAQPALMIVGYLALASLGLATAVSALWWYLLVVVAVFILASVMLWRVQPTAVHQVARDIGDLPRWRRAILPLALVSATTVISTQISVLLLGFYGNEEAIAQMRVAERGALLAVFPTLFMNSIIGPYFITALKHGKKDEIRRVTRYSARLVFAASVPLALILLFFGRNLLAWTFGAPYDALAYLPMMILIGAHIVSFALGDGGMLLALGQHEKHTLYAQLLSLAITLVMASALIVPFGAVGAAIGAGAGILSAKVYSYFAVWRKFGISAGVF